MHDSPPWVRGAVPSLLWWGGGHTELCICPDTSGLGSFASSGGARQPGAWRAPIGWAHVPPLTTPPGAALLDLEQTTLPGIAHLVVETMIVSDQIRPEDRASVLRTLLLKHRCQGGVPGRGPPGSAAPQEYCPAWLSSFCLNTPK